MAKKSSIVKNEKRKLLAEKFEPLRKELRKKQANLKLPEGERLLAGIQLQKLPKRASRCRVVNRCRITGRARGNFKKFGLSRLMFRKMAHEGLIPGVIKSSW
ncbi:MAG: 30S ribosomal protein S14 [Oligoflexia bacterium]|nr:30S ribosomal protein S14 [Oligoflexia bacterium]